MNDFITKEYELAKKQLEEAGESENAFNVFLGAFAEAVEDAEEKQDQEDYKLAEERIKDNNPKYSLEEVEAVLDIDRKARERREEQHDEMAQKLQDFYGDGRPCTIPNDEHHPNEVTLKTMQDADNGDTLKAKSVEQLLDE